MWKILKQCDEGFHNEYPGSCYKSVEWKGEGLKATHYCALSKITLYLEKWNTAEKFSKRGKDAHVEGFHIKAQ